MRQRILTGEVMVFVDLSKVQQIVLVWHTSLQSRMAFSSSLLIQPLFIILPSLLSLLDFLIRPLCELLLPLP